MVVLLAAAGLFAASRGDLSQPAARYLSHEIGRKVSIGQLNLRLGWVTAIDLRDVTVSNIAGGTRPSMITLNRLDAQLRLLSILKGPIFIPSISIKGGNLLLERRADGRANWKFQTSGAAPVSAKSNGIDFPTTLKAHFSDLEIDFRASSGELLKTAIKDGSVTTPASNAPVTLKATGSYNDIPVDLNADLASFDTLHRGAIPFPAKISVTSGPSSLHFNGTFIDPLNVDGANGKLEFGTSSLADLAHVAGISVPQDIPLQLSGDFVHAGGLWRLSNAGGALAAQDFKGALELDEGASRQPDAIKVSAAFSNLDTNAILKPKTGESQPAAGVSLMMDPAPGTLVDAQVTAGHFVYRTILADDFDIKVKTGPGTLAIDDFAFSIAGGMAKSKIAIADKDDKAVVDFDGSLTGVDADKAGVLLGWGPLPVDGPVNSHVIGRMIGADMTEARRTNRIFGVVAMDGGAIDRQVVGMAGTDIRLLFGADDGVRKLHCLLAVINLRDGKGTIGPVRIKSSAGTIAGNGSYDSVHDSIDLVIGAQSKSWFALDVPVRISGPINNFSVRPAFGASRTLNEIGLPDDLPQALKDIATANPCLTH